jgi:methyl-accepting chemotaxis protein
VSYESKELSQQTAKAKKDIRERIASIQSVANQTVGDISEIFLKRALSLYIIVSACRHNEAASFP